MLRKFVVLVFIMLVLVGCVVVREQVVVTATPEPTATATMVPIPAATRSANDAVEQVSTGIFAEIWPWLEVPARDTFYQTRASIAAISAYNQCPELKASIGQVYALYSGNEVSANVLSNNLESMGKQSTDCKLYEAALDVILDCRREDDDRFNFGMPQLVWYVLNAKGATVDDVAYLGKDSCVFLETSYDPDSGGFVWK